jgi:hypothetical protein
MSNWFDTGYKGAQEQSEKKQLGYGPRRLWLKPEASKQVGFVDDDPFCIHEHQFKNANGDWEFATCIAKISAEGCPGDGAKGVLPAAYIGFLTVVDIDGYTKEGEVKGQFEMQLLTPKTMMLNKLRSRKETKVTLVNNIYKLTRTSKEAASTGDDIEHIREVKSLEGFFASVTYKGNNVSEMIANANNGDEKVRKYLDHHFQIPSSGPIPNRVPVFNYAKLLEPMNPTDFRAAISGAQVLQGGGFAKGGKAGTGTAKGPAGSSDDTPF